MIGFGPLTIVAYEAIPMGAPVTFNGRVASSNLLASFWRVAGFSKVSTNRGFAVELITSGEFKNDNFNWTPEREVYLNGTALSQTPPSSRFVQILGIAKDSKTVIIKLSEPIRL